MNRILIALFSGMLFGMGLSLSQMANPQKVIDFLDITGHWDPSLAFVMAGALAVAIPGFRWVKKQQQPVFETRFHLPAKTVIDKPLLLGAVIFGIGWGLGGYCPGPAITGIGLGNLEAWVAVISIYLGSRAKYFFIDKTSTAAAPNRNQ